ncbi:cytochrome P450 [Hyaloscypha bicolor E]|uniref:Cytochrome P450 n=1 Tax=Hyaloscypha bicolor E TaxID=1095630 RepID=A0A2J6SNJ2_9HELO|nr:cytochrome P450 [Hyaloscypha bicolor E]PMD52339.1 cytochrome P450 [Hyaloscypha bicolor E]
MNFSLDLILVCGFILVGWYIRSWQNTQQRLKTLGGRGATVPGLPFGIHIVFGLIKNWFCDGLVEYCSDLQGRFGHTLDFNILGMRLVVTDEPQNFEAIMSTKFKEYGKGENLHRTWNNLMGDSIFATDGQLSKGWDSDFERTELHVQKLLDKLSAKKIVNVSNLSSRFALDVVSDIFLEKSANTLETEKFLFGEAMDKLQAYNTIRTCFGWIGSIMPTVFLSGAMIEVEKYLALQVERIMAMPIYSTLGKEAQSSRLVDSLHSKCRNAKEMRDQIIAVLLAGKDPFGLTLAWALHELALNPEIVRKLRAEIVTHVGLERLPTPKDIQKMTYLKNIIQETLRLYPPLGFNSTPWSLFIVILVSSVKTHMFSGRGAGRHGNPLSGIICHLTTDPVSALGETSPSFSSNTHCAVSFRCSKVSRYLILEKQKKH